MKCSFLLGITRQNFIEMARQIKKKNSDLGSGGGIIQYIDPSPPLFATDIPKRVYKLQSPTQFRPRISRISLFLFLFLKYVLKTDRSSA